MKRNIHNSSDTGKCCLEKLKCNEYYTQEVLGHIKDIKRDLLQFTFHMKMDTVDLSQFFPLQSHEPLLEFMNRGHEDWNLRRKGFYHLLFTTVTKSQKKFAAALLHTLFTRNFIRKHRWPG